MDLTRNIYVSSGAFQSKLIGEILDSCIRSNIRNLELSSGVDFETGIVDKVRFFHGKPLTFLVHNYFPPHVNSFVLNLAAMDRTIIDRSVAHCRFSIDLAAEFGAPFYSVHAGAAMKAKPADLGRPLAHALEDDVDQAYAVFVRTTQQLAEYAASKGIQFLIENHVVAHFNVVRGRQNFLFASNPSEIRKFVEDVGAKNLGILLDVGHLKVTANTFGFDPRRAIDELAPYIRAFHLSENDGKEDQNLPFDDQAWFIPLLRRFKDAIHVIESYRMRIEQIQKCHGTVASAIA